MARPKKQEVDYFPHYCDHGKVLFILENHFKNDGYAVFYKIEELLAKTEGHCYDCSKLENWEYLLSKMLVTEDIVINIIEKLSSMGVIDKELWQQKKIWMQSFIDSIADAYARRKVQLPTRPVLINTKTQLNGINDDINSQEASFNQNDDNHNPQSKVNKSKVNNNIIYTSDSHEIRLSEILFNLIHSRDEKIKQPDYQKWATHINKLIRVDSRSPDEIEKVIRWCQKDIFWQSNILSTKKLREKFSQLYLKMGSNGNGTINGRQGITGSSAAFIGKTGNAQSTGEYPPDREY